MQERIDQTALYLNSNWPQMKLVGTSTRTGYHRDNKGPACPLSTLIISCHIHFWTQMPHLHAWDPTSLWHHADSSHTCTAYKSPTQTEQQLPSWFMHFFSLCSIQTDKRKLCAVQQWSFLRNAKNDHKGIYNIKWNNQKRNV